MHTPKKKKKKRRSTYQTWCLRLLVLFLSTVVMGDGQEAWHLLLRTAPRRRPSRLGQFWQKTFVDVFNKYSQHFTTKMPFLTTSRITFSCLASVAPQADSWWLEHLVTDDVVIADIGGQALDILLHGPESAHKNSIVKTFIHTSIPIHTPCTLLKKKKKKGAQLTKHDAFVYWSSSCPPWWWATVRKLGTCFSGLLHVGGLLA